MTRTAGRLPDLVIAGVTKAATTSLFTYLTQHPSVCGSSIKSTQHFLPLRYGRPAPPLDRYRSYFTGCADAAVVVEATPGYFYGGHAVADELRRSVPGVKVIIVLREPVSRLVSYYRFQQSMLTVPLELTIDQYVATCDSIAPERFCDPRLADPDLDPWLGVQGGRYDSYLPAWLQFGTDLRILFFDDLVGDPRGTVTELAAWLGISAAPFDELGFLAENRTVLPRYTGVQRAAFGVRRKLGGVLRGHPSLTRSLRRTYHFFNSNPAVPAQPTSTQFGDRFRASNYETARILRDAGITRLADWLATAAPEPPAANAPPPP